MIINLFSISLHNIISEFLKFMSRKFLVLFVFIFFSCTDSGSGSSDENPNTIEDSYVIVNGIKAYTGILYNAPPYVTKKNGVFNIGFSVGVNSLKHYFSLQITEQGNIIYISDFTDTVSYYNRTYYNFRNYPDFFSEVLMFNYDEQRKTFNLELKANLYLDSNNIDSENINVEFNLNGNYEDQPDTDDYLLSNRLDYCSAKFNNVDWTAMMQYENGSFTNYGPYKIKVIFNSSTPVANYTFTQTDNVNCIKFYKFNIQTFQYDEFNVLGNVNLYYKEFHGMSPNLLTYSFFGTFNITAVNPIDSSEVISITDGKFRTLNPY